MEYKYSINFGQFYWIFNLPFDVSKQKMLAMDFAEEKTKKLGSNDLFVIFSPNLSLHSINILKMFHSYAKSQNGLFGQPKGTKKLDSLLLSIRHSN